MANKKNSQGYGMFCFNELVLLAKQLAQRI